MAKGEHLFWRKHSIDLINEMVLKKLARKHGVFRAMGMLMIAQDYLAAHDFIDKSNDGIESLLMFCNDNQATEDEIISFLDDVVATGYFELDEQGRYFCPNVFVEYQKKKDLSKKQNAVLPMRALLFSLKKEMIKRSFDFALIFTIAIAIAITIIITIISIA